MNRTEKTRFLKRAMAVVPKTTIAMMGYSSIVVEGLTLKGHQFAVYHESYFTETGVTLSPIKDSTKALAPELLSNITTPLLLPRMGSRTYRSLDGESLILELSPTVGVQQDLLNLVEGMNLYRNSSDLLSPIMARLDGEIIAVIAVMKLSERV
jgi:hypothetical protein